MNRDSPDGSPASAGPHAAALGRSRSSASATSADDDELDDRLANSAAGPRFSLYIGAFTEALDGVLAGELGLFSEDEQATFGVFQSLSENARKLYVRLFLRKPRWIRASTLETYAEVADLAGALRELRAHGFLESSLGHATLDEMLETLSADELRALARDTGCATAAPKAALRQTIRRSSRGQSRLSFSGGGLSIAFDGQGNKITGDDRLRAQVDALAGERVRTAAGPRELFDRVHIVFFRSTSLDERPLTALVLALSARRTYPTYNVSRSTDVFRSRDGLLDYERTLQLQLRVDALFGALVGSGAMEELRALLEPERDRWWAAATTTAPPQTPAERLRARYTAGHVRTRLMYKLAAVLCRLQAHAEAHELYGDLLAQHAFRRDRRGEWYQQRALIETRYLGDDRAAGKRRALATCLAGLQDPDTHEIYQGDLARRTCRLERELRVLPRLRHDFSHVALRQAAERTFHGTRVDAGDGGRSQWLDAAGDRTTVENMCLGCYERDGWRGRHTEGGIVRSLFALVLWEVLFQDVPGAFETKYQTAPLDLGTDAFYGARAAALEARLAQVRAGQASDLVAAAHAALGERAPTCAGMDWRIPADDLVEAAACIPGPALARIFELLCCEWTHRSSGMPDLFLWNYERRRCLFAEVKSENDRLSDTQRLWIDVLVRQGVAVELCHALHDASEPIARVYSETLDLVKPEP
ncbi:VRR-NUC domain-containing protein [Dipodascopsis tothii]|uniref:VRR-NUC domain-containing protein n=1 Tax=Dipodascopsis tothii TaxID=44089 RepID=UPI0034CDF654